MGDGEAAAETEGKMEAPTEARGSNSPEVKEKRRYGRCVRVMWKEKLRLMKGTAPMTVLEKKLLSADVSKSHATLLLRRNNDDGEEERSPMELLQFMTEAEKTSAAAKNGGMPVVLLDRKGDEYPEAKITYLQSMGAYAVAGEWLNVVSNNQLRCGDVVDIYTFRVPPQAAAPSSSSSPPPASSEEGNGGGGTHSEWRLGLAVCARVPADEIVSRRLASSCDSQCAFDRSSVSSEESYC
ncbi:unnamed protein product [Spirodela intermedia]|uniref:Uncharacterized protein n=1 Tax=Spirodela intermedia TaxID=51605 RepID=A0A7I8KYK2_SPIIN|nr:unnamed protein product [Spirodela intermedia]